MDNLPERVFASIAARGQTPASIHVGLPSWRDSYEVAWETMAPRVDDWELTRPGLRRLRPPLPDALPDPRSQGGYWSLSRSSSHERASFDARTTPPMRSGDALSPNRGEKDYCPTRTGSDCDPPFARHPKDCGVDGGLGSAVESQREGKTP